MFGLQPVRHISTLPKTAVCRRSGERPESLRVFGRLPGTGVMRCAEAGVRKASGEETAGRRGTTERRAGAARWSYGDLRAAGNRLRRGEGDRQMESIAG